MPPLTVFERVNELLKEHLAIFPSKTELTEAEIEHWHRDLESYPLAAIEWAFDNWRRNGRFFPVFADIIDLCSAWAPHQQMREKGCSQECQSRHGKGYGDVDMLVFAKLFLAKRGELNRPLTNAELDGVLDEVDKKRGGAPEWRA
jgi:hypothetical protein